MAVSPLAQYLPGEIAPSTEQLRELLELANQVQKAEPWNRFADQQLVVATHPVTGEPVYCCIMGGIGQFFAVHVYIGEQGLSTFCMMRDRLLEGAAEIYSRSRYVGVEWAHARDFTPDQTELLEALGVEVKAGRKLPRFESARPGYWPWYPNAEEAEVLAEGLRVVLAADRNFGALAEKHWKSKDEYPRAEAVPGSAGEYTWTSFVAPEPQEPTLVPAPLDRERVERIQAAGYEKGRAVELDHLWLAIQIGEENRRASLAQMVMIVEQRGGHAHPPKLESPEMPANETVQNAVLRVIEETKRIPQKVIVRGLERRAWVSELARALGFRVEVEYRFKELDHAVAAVKRFMGAE
ncbi:MAG: hypothetical protein U0Q16_16670 [Bryobacteraceae bacterium]